MKCGGVKWNRTHRNGSTERCGTLTRHPTGSKPHKEGSSGLRISQVILKDGRCSWLGGNAHGILIARPRDRSGLFSQGEIRLIRLNIWRRERERGGGEESDGNSPTARHKKLHKDWQCSKQKETRRRRRKSVSLVWANGTSKRLISSKNPNRIPPNRSLLL